MLGLELGLQGGLGVTGMVSVKGLNSVRAGFTGGVIVLVEGTIKVRVMVRTNVRVTGIVSSRVRVTGRDCVKFGVGGGGGLGSLSMGRQSTPRSLCRNLQVLVYLVSLISSRHPFSLYIKADVSL